MYKGKGVGGTIDWSRVAAHLGMVLQRSCPILL